MQIRIIFLTIIFFSYSFASLYELYKATLKNNYKLKSIHYQIKAQEYKLKEAKDNYFPTFSLNTSYGLDKYQYNYPTKTIRYNSKTYSYTFSIKQPLYVPKIFALIKDNKLKLKYQKLQQKKQLNEILKEISISYIDLITYTQLQKIQKQKIDYLKKVLEEISLKLSLKLSTIDEYTYTKALLQKANSEYKTSKLMIKFLTKKLELLTFCKKISYPSQISTLPAIPQKIDINNSYDLKTAKINMQISKNEIQKRKYDKYPNINLSTSYSDTDSSDSITRRKNFRAFIELSMPIFNKQTNDSIEEAIQLYQSSVYDYKNLYNELITQKEQTYLNINKLLSTIKSDKAEIENKKTLLKKAEISYNSKLISLSSFIKAKNDYLDAIVTLKRDYGELFKNYVYLFYLEGSLSKNIEKISKLIQGE